MPLSFLPRKNDSHGENNVDKDIINNIIADNVITTLSPKAKSKQAFSSVAGTPHKFTKSRAVGQ